jgi:hypothetical protein
MLLVKYTTWLEIGLCSDDTVKRRLNWLAGWVTAEPVFQEAW